MATHDRKLAAHLARRAGFGATPDELDYYESMTYEDLVDHFLDRESIGHVTDDMIYRRHPNIHANLLIIQCTGPTACSLPIHL